VVRFIVRWGIRIAAFLAVAFIAVYLGDFLVFKLRSSPQSIVTVNQYLDVPLKGNKHEFDYQGTMAVPCARALFSQSGLSPCWQLRKNANQMTPL